MASLIITEGNSPSTDGLGYPRMPGLHKAAHAPPWKATTTSVHDHVGQIFVKSMHCDRVAHLAKLPAVAELLGRGATGYTNYRALPA
jgi:N-ethylmaleimide reductase